MQNEIPTVLTSLKTREWRKKEEKNGECMNKSSWLLDMQVFYYVVVCIFLSENLVKRSKMTIIKPPCCYVWMRCARMTTCCFLFRHIRHFFFCLFFNLFLVCIFCSPISFVPSLFYTWHSSHFVVGAYRRYFISIKSSNKPPMSISHFMLMFIHFLIHFCLWFLLKEMFAMDLCVRRVCMWLMLLPLILFFLSVPFIAQ